jgi:zinc/manganese transport system substrate-binding protein
MSPWPRLWPRLVAAASTAVVPLAGGCGSSSSSTAPGVISAVAAESQYADVLRQIGGKYVRVSAILSNPNTDPHTFESSPSIASEVGAAGLIVENGLGYDDFMSKIESASPSSSRRVIDAQDVLHLPDNTPNPHLWYDPNAMPAVAQAMADDLAALQPAHAAYFQANLAAFNSSLTPLHDAIAAFKAKYFGTAVATTEPVADYLLAAMGLDDLTPFGFQADIMNGVDPTPQDISLEDGLFARHQVRVFCYNPQVADSLTTSIRQTAIHAGIPVVAVYETMPSPGFHFQTWMLAEVNAIERALTTGASKERL